MDTTMNYFGQPLGFTELRIEYSSVMITIDFGRNLA